MPRGDEHISGGVCMLLTGSENWFVQSVFGKYLLAITLLFRKQLLQNLMQGDS